jgi:hypothetical protein
VALSPVGRRSNLGLFYPQGRSILTNMYPIMHRWAMAEGAAVGSPQFQSDEAFCLSVSETPLPPPVRGPRGRAARVERLNSSGIIWAFTHGSTGVSCPIPVVCSRWVSS